MILKIISETAPYLLFKTKNKGKDQKVKNKYVKYIFK